MAYSAGTSVQGDRDIGRPTIGRMVETTLNRTLGADVAGRSEPRRGLPVGLWAVLAVVLWGGVLWLGARLFAMTPPSAGFDLDLIVRAGVRVAQGAGPYDPSMLAGHAPTAEDLFYSYPPPVAQGFALIAGVPTGIALLGLAVVAVAGLALVARELARRLDPAHSVGSAVVPVIAIAPLVFPFAIATLFGNLDLLFPLLYGALLLAVLPGAPALAAVRPGRSWSAVFDRFGGARVVAGGASLALAAVAKLHPASLGVWFLVRGARDRRDLARGGDLADSRASVADHRAIPTGWRVLIVAAVVGVAIVAMSLVVGGLGPWQDYLDVVRVGAAADIVDRRNIGPAAQIALLLGGSETLARVLQLPIALAAVAVTAWAAWSRRDAVESLAIAATASLVILPVTWFHYPVALLPFAVAAWLRARAGTTATITLRWLAVAGVIAAFAIVLPVTLWLAVAAVLLAVRASGRGANDLHSATLSDPVTVGANATPIAN